MDAGFENVFKECGMSDNTISQLEFITFTAEKKLNINDTIIAQ